LCVGVEYFWDRISQIIYLGWLQTMILLISASWVTRIIGLCNFCNWVEYSFYLHNFKKTGELQEKVFARITIYFLLTVSRYLHSKFCIHLVRKLAKTWPVMKPSWNLYPKYLCIFLQKVGTEGRAGYDFRSKYVFLLWFASIVNRKKRI
jgi:hypothetical protein